MESGKGKRETRGRERREETGEVGQEGEEAGVPVSGQKLAVGWEARGRVKAGFAGGGESEQ